MCFERFHRPTLPACRTVKKNVETSRTESPSISGSQNLLGALLADMQKHCVFFRNLRVTLILLGALHHFRVVAVAVAVALAVAVAVVGCGCGCGCLLWWAWFGFWMSVWV